jgi:pyrimidine operon attenuation protein / uracil phosphoribosyltransferase
MADKKYILNKEVAAQKLHRLALEVAEQLDGDTADLILIGVKENGFVIAQKVANIISNYTKANITVLWLSLNKLLPNNIVLSDATVNFNNKNVILVDDVANSGKTLLYALKPLLAFHPKRIQTLVLVDRMHKLFPVKSDYVGLSIATTLQDHIEVEVVNDEIMGAYI